MLNGKYNNKREKLILKNTNTNKIYKISLRGIIKNKNIFNDNINKESVINLAKEKFGLINIDNKRYKNIDTKFKFTDGTYLYNYSYKSIENNKKISPFSIHNIYTNKNIDSFLLENGYNIKRLTGYEHSDKLIKFKCNDCGNVWETSFSIIRSCSIGCPVCAAMSHKGGFNSETANRFKNKWIKIKSNLYLFKIYNKNKMFYKIGITTKKDPNNRFDKEYMYDYKYDLLFSKINNLYENVLFEDYLHNKFSKYSYIPENKISGYTECYNLELGEQYIVKTIKGDYYEAKKV